MNAVSYDVFPFRLQWSSQELADAVPLRLFELVDFSAGAREAASANAASLKQCARRVRTYLPKVAMAARFRIGG